MMLVMIDMDLGNLGSVCQALRRIGALVTVTNRADEIERASAVILPGVGAFADGMTSLHRNELVEPLRRHVLDRGRPLLGICLGMQLLAEDGEEYGLHSGLGFVRGRVIRLNPPDRRWRVPNIGWCDLRIERPGVLVSKSQDKTPFYFAHSYYLRCSDADDVVATIDYGERLPAAIERSNVFGIQFHPEKSQDAGLDLLEAFCRYVRDRSPVGGDNS